DFFKTPLTYQKFQNKTNGITPRRWLLLANPSLADLICERIGEDWITNLDELRQLEKFANDVGFLDAIGRIKRDNKLKFAQFVKESFDVDINPSSMYDVHVK